MASKSHSQFDLPTVTYLQKRYLMLEEELPPIAIPVRDEEEVGALQSITGTIIRFLLWNHGKTAFLSTHRYGDNGWRAKFYRMEDGDGYKLKACPQFAKDDGVLVNHCAGECPCESLEKAKIAPCVVLEIFAPNRDELRGIIDGAEPYWLCKYVGDFPALRKSLSNKGEIQGYRLLLPINEGEENKAKECALDSNFKNQLCAIMSLGIVSMLHKAYISMLMGKDLSKIEEYRSYKIGDRTYANLDENLSSFSREHLEQYAGLKERLCAIVASRRVKHTVINEVKPQLKGMGKAVRKVCSIMASKDDYPRGCDVEFPVCNLPLGRQYGITPADAEPFFAFGKMLSDWAGKKVLTKEDRDLGETLLQAVDGTVARLDGFRTAVRESYDVKLTSKKLKELVKESLANCWRKDSYTETKNEEIQWGSFRRIYRPCIKGLIQAFIEKHRNTPDVKFDVFVEERTIRIIQTGVDRVEKWYLRGNLEKYVNKAEGFEIDVQFNRGKSGASDENTMDIVFPVWELDGAILMISDSPKDIQDWTAAFPRFEDDNLIRICDKTPHKLAAAAEKSLGTHKDSIRVIILDMNWSGNEILALKFIHHVRSNSSKIAQMPIIVSTNFIKSEIERYCVDLDVSTIWVKKEIPLDVRRKIVEKDFEKVSNETMARVVKEYADRVADFESTVQPKTAEVCTTAKAPTNHDFLRKINALSDILCEIVKGNVLSQEVKTLLGKICGDIISFWGLFLQSRKDANDLGWHNTKEAFLRTEVVPKVVVILQRLWTGTADAAMPEELATQLKELLEILQNRSTI